MLHVICYMDLNSPLGTIGRISPVYLKRLRRLGIKTVKDLLYHFPHRYDDFSKITPIGQIKINEIVTVQGKILEIKNTRTWKKRMLLTEAIVGDKTGAIKAVWFNQPFLLRNLKKGQTFNLAGKILYNGQTLYFSNPAYENIPISDIRYPISSLKHTGRLVPVYPETEGLTSRWLRYIIKTILPVTRAQIKDYLPMEIKRSQGLLDLPQALEQIHFPKTKKQVEIARRRLAFDELFLIQLFVLNQKLKWQKQNAPRIAFNQPLIKKFVDSLPFKLTNAQRKAAWEILQDLVQAKPMNRLLEGDVGSGKTVVATIAALEVAQVGYQVALMAPTEILSQQHFREITKLLSNSGIIIGLLTGSESKTCYMSQVKCHKKNELLDKIRQGKTNILIGTHALIQKGVQFKNLALVIVDEQHRFGVAQRAALQKNVSQIEDGLINTIPHLLSMTATPIPRTLALTIYGDLDISFLDEMPKGRQEIITKIVAPTNRDKAYNFIRQQIRQGRQVFVICPRIEPTTNNQQPTTNRNRWDEVKAVKEEYEKLSKYVFPDLRIAMLHGKLKSKEKEQIMKDFKNAKIDILVSTSVVEVGIDIANATVMMIEGADRFGLAQLHQFRGRVGRGQHQSYCFLFTDSTAKTTHSRLKAILTAKSGFELAEKDLEIRGPGEFYGTRQWGLPDLSMASLADLALIQQVRTEAAELLTKDQELKNYPLLKDKLKEFQTAIHLE